MQYKLVLTEEEFQQMRPMYRLLYAVYTYDPPKQKKASPALQRYRENNKEKINARARARRKAKKETAC